MPRAAERHERAAGPVARSARLRTGAWLHRLRERPGRFRDLKAATCEAAAAQWDQHLLERRAGDRLEHVVGAASRRGFYGGEQLERSRNPLDGFGVLEKDRLHAAAGAMMRAAPADVELTTTSGTSGRVTQLLRPRAADVERAALDRRLYDSLGLPDFFDFVIVVPWRDPGAARWGLHDWRVRCQQIALEDVANATQRGERIGDVLIAVPAVCRRLAQWGLASRHALAAGFELADSAKARVLGTTERRDAAPAELYSASELCAPIAFRFPDCLSLHLNSDAVHVEVVVPGTTTAAGEGEAGDLIVTDLLNDAMPLIRYRIGDLGAIDHRQCRCRRATPTLRLMGRTSPVGAAVADLLAASSLGRSEHGVLVQTRIDELICCGNDPPGPEAQRVAAERDVRLLWRREVPAALAPLTPHLRLVCLAERIPSDRATARTLRQLHNELGIFDPRVELGVVE